MVNRGGAEGSGPDPPAGGGVEGFRPEKVSGARNTLAPRGKYEPCYGISSLKASGCLQSAIINRQSSFLFFGSFTLFNSLSSSSSGI